jgi:threonine 3-dehydrogenase
VTILITGGIGFLGSNLAKELVSRGEEVLLTYSTNSTLNPYVQDIEGQVKKVKVDLSCWSEVLDVVKEFEIDKIFHCGGFLSHKAEDHPFKAFEVNLLGTLYILEAARLFSVKQVVFTSTIATFGDHITVPVPNYAPHFPGSIYGVTKSAAERLGEYYNLKYNLDFRGMRFPSVIGPGRGPGGASAYTTLIIENPARKKAYEIFVEPACRITILYIKDAIRAMLELSAADEVNLDYRVYNIGGFSPSVSELTEAVKVYIPEAEFNYNPIPEMVRVINSWPSYIDDSAARKDWGWTIEYDLEKTIKSFIKAIESTN